MPNNKADLAHLRRLRKIITDAGQQDTHDGAHVIGQLDAIIELLDAGADISDASVRNAMWQAHLYIGSAE